MIAANIYEVKIKPENYNNEITPSLSLDEYLKLAKEIIHKCADTIRSGLAYELLSSDDSISDIAYTLMTADMKWSSKGGASLSSWRIEQAKRAMQRYIGRKNRKEVIFKNIGDPVFFISGEPPMDLEEFDDHEEHTIILDKIFHGSGLTSQERVAVDLRSQGYSYKDMGEQMECSRETARKSYVNGVDKMRIYCDRNQIRWG